MSFFDNIIFTEAITINGKPVPDEDEQQGGATGGTDNAAQGSTETDQTQQQTPETTTDTAGTDSTGATNTDNQTTGNDTQDAGTPPATGGGFGTPVDNTPQNTDQNNEDDNDDYTTMKPDDDTDDTQNQPAQANDDDYTQITPDEGESSAADSEPTDYTQMNQDDDAEDDFSGDAGTAPPDTTGTPPATTGATPDTGGDTDDYTQMTPDDAGDGGTTNDIEVGQNPNPDAAGNAPGDPTAAGDGPAGTPPTGGGAADEPDTDYGELSPDDDSSEPGAPDDGNNPDGSQDPSADTSGEGGEDGNADDQSGLDGDATGSEGQDELKNAEAQLYSDFTPEQLQIRDNELKVQFINLYEDIEKTENRVNRIVKTDENESVVMFVVKRLEELKNATHDSLISSYQTRSYYENQLQYYTLLANLASIGKMLEELAKRSSKSYENKARELEKQHSDISDDITASSDQDIETIL